MKNIFSGSHFHILNISIFLTIISYDIDFITFMLSKTQAQGSFWSKRKV